MREVLYVQTDRNMKVVREQILLGEIAKLSCADKKVLARNQVRRVATLPRGKYGRYVMSASDLIREITKEEPDVEVTHIGEPSFVITYEKESGKSALWSWTKTAAVSLIAFFGTAFSIMTFNADVDVSGLFGDIYRMFTGRASDGFTVLEVTYSIGIAIGVVFYFNHFGKRKITRDPTPMEVQMRLYEDDVDTTIIEKMRREGSASCGSRF